MFQRLCIATLGLSSALLVAVSQADLTIANAGFESPAAGDPDGWGVGGVDLADVSTDFALADTQSLKFTAPPAFEQQTEVFQGVTGSSGSAGQELAYTVNLYTPSANPWNAAFFVLGIEFKKLLPGGGDTFVSGGEQVIVPEALSPDQWKSFTFNLAATGDWDFVVLKLKTIGVGNPDGGTGVIYADNVSAVIPEPSTLALTGLGILALARRRRDPSA